VRHEDFADELRREEVVVDHAGRSREAAGERANAVDWTVVVGDQAVVSRLAGRPKHGGDQRLEGGVESKARSSMGMGEC
jgi:hypothetical protein